MPSISSSTRVSTTHEQISRYAQELWEKYGRPYGRDEEIWLEAERNLKSAQGTASGSPAMKQRETTTTAATSAPSARPARSSTGSASPRMPGNRAGSRKQ